MKNIKVTVKQKKPKVLALMAQRRRLNALIPLICCSVGSHPTLKMWLAKRFLARQHLSGKTRKFGWWLKFGKELSRNFDVIYIRIKNMDLDPDRFQI